MAFALKADESAAKGVKRLVRKQVASAVEGLTKRSGGKQEEAVHDARKRFKKVRALLRLVRPELGEKVYKRENARFRDAARPLSEVRDARVLVEALDALVERSDDGESFGPVRKALQARQRVIRRRVLKDEQAPAQVVEAVEEARQRLKGWAIGRKGWAALAKGLKRVYKAGRDAFDAALAEPSVENLHEWRKQVKYLWHQLQVLGPTWPELMEGLGNQAHRLSDHLGDDHDLAVLRQLIEQEGAQWASTGTLLKLLDLIDVRRGELQHAAAQLGQRLYADRPKAFLNRLHSYWQAWRSDGEGPEGTARAGGANGRKP
jgi:CHAD domain-containing protein